MNGDVYHPTPLEIATGLLFGVSPPEPLPVPAGDPVEALEAAILPALLRPPCVVTFSGGRDSSTILALAVRLARREGLELPVPLTSRFPGVDGADERAWQEQVIVHLGLTNWIRVDYADELDLVGPIAMRVLSRFGLVSPFNLHFFLPFVEEASGGSLLTGLGGDEALGTPRWARAVAVLSGRKRPRPRDLLAVSLAAAPPTVRRTVLSRRETVVLPWLRPSAQEEMWRLMTADIAAEPLRWQYRASWARRLRYVQIGIRTLDRLAAGLRVEVVNPFVDAGFAASLAALPRERRFVSRSAAMHELFGGLLPAEILSRSTKSEFGDAFWRTHSRALVESWDGEGLDEELVDPAELRREWSKRVVDGRSFLLLQSLALARLESSGSGELPQAVGGLA